MLVKMQSAHVGSPAQSFSPFASQYCVNLDLITICKSFYALTNLQLFCLHFGPYWARQMVKEARSNQLIGHVSHLLDLHKNPNEDEGCRVYHAVERLVALSVPGQVIILGTKTHQQNKIV